jgi:hypothetical protein
MDTPARISDSWPVDLVFLLLIIQNARSSHARNGVTENARRGLLQQLRKAGSALSHYQLIAATTS